MSDKRMRLTFAFSTFLVSLPHHNLHSNLEETQRPNGWLSLLIPRPLLICSVAEFGRVLVLGSLVSCN